MIPKVSLIIPVFNGKDHIKRFLDCVFSQRLKNFEVIIVDDGSRDDSFSIIKNTLYEYEREDISVTLKRQENQGVAKTRNHGISLAKGEYIMFCDYDDSFDRDYLETYVDAAESGNFEVVVGGYVRKTYSGKEMFRVSLKDSEWGKFVVGAPWAHIYKRDFIEQNNIRFLDSSIGEDIYFNIIAYSLAGKVGTVNHIGYNWLYNESSISNKTQNSISEDVDPLFLMDSIFNDMNNAEFRDSEYMEYFMLRYACWYMLFSARGSKKRDIKNMYDRLMSWLFVHYPNFKMNKYISKMPEGEVKKTHRFVRTFYAFDKIGIMKGILCLL